MGNELSLLEKKLADEPIILPDNAYVESFKTFGRDELIAAGINIGATAVSASLGLGNLGTSVAGPIVEKFGFFPAHFKEAREIYKTTPKEHRESIWFYTKKSLKSGFNSLLLDVLVHDPMYIGMMYAGLNLSPNTPAWALATASFAGAVVVAAGVDVGFSELRYKNLKGKLKRRGFEPERYLESRFLVRKDQNPQAILSDIASRFDLGETKVNEYQDRYFKTNLKGYSGRIPKVRLRERTNTHGDVDSEHGKMMQTAQVVYTKASRQKSGSNEQYNFFPQKKEKMYLLLNDQEMPDHIDDIKNKRARRLLKDAVNEDKYQDVEFIRRYAVKDTDGLFASVDEVDVDRPFHVVELKVRKNPKQLMEAMRYVMLEFPVLQITHGKYDLLNNG
jgi:hypothetical protein